MGLRRWILMGRTVVRENLLWEDTPGLLFFRASPDWDYPRVYFRRILATIPSAATSVLHKRASAQTSSSVMLFLFNI